MKKIEFLFTKPLVNKPSIFPKIRFHNLFNTYLIVIMREQQYDKSRNFSRQ